MTDRDLRRKIVSARSVPEAFRAGDPVIDQRVVTDAEAAGKAADDRPQVVELDCNPVVVLESGAAVVDARVRVEPAATPPPLGACR